MAAALAGVVPVVPTIFRDDETVDLDATVRVVDYLMDAGVDGLCLLANYSEQFSLSDAERDAIARALLEHVAGRLPVIVQDAPLSATPLPAGLLIDLVRQVPQVQYAKIEVPQAADKLHALVSTLGDSLPGPFDGEESVTLIPDLDAGATGTMPSSTVPAELGQIVRCYRAGDRAGAVSAWEALLPLIHFENRQCGLRAQKILLAESGIIACDRTRAPFGPVSPRTRSGLIELAARHDLLILRWAR